MNNIPKSISTIIKEFDSEEIKIGCSDSAVYKLTKKEITYYLKVAKSGLLTREYNALKWLQGKLEIPKIIKYEVINDMEYLLTESLEGEMLCNKYYQNNPTIAIDILVEALKKIQKTNIAECPFNVDIDYKLNLVKNNVEQGLITNDDIDKELLDKYNGVKGILKYLEENKFYDENIFSHGDVSLPNIFAKKNKLIGFIDLGECGIADKWFDLAICEKSIIRNLGKEYVELFYKKLNIVRDRKKIEYYLLMMNLYL